MRVGEIVNMDVIAYASTVRRVIIITEDTNLLPPPQGDIEYEWD